jgi:hypothetical protein
MLNMKIKNIYCPICHRQTYFTGKVVYESKRTQVIEWQCSDCGAILKSRHDKLGERYNQRIKKGNLSPKPSIWIRKGNYWDLLFFEVGKKLYAFKAMDVERLERDEILPYRCIRSAIKTHDIVGIVRLC